MPPQQRNTIYEDESIEHDTRPSVQKRFNFNLSANEIFPIPHIDDLCDEEVRDTWYERGDYEKIKNSLIPLIRKMMKGEYVEESDRQTIRGLEYRTRKGAIRRQHNKAEAVTTVLDEQEFLIEQVGHANEEQLARAYIQVSAHCQEEAHKLALTDVKPAQQHCANASIAHVLEEYGSESRSVPERKPSFGKMLKQMRIRRRPTIVSRPSYNGAAPAVSSAA